MGQVYVLHLAAERALPTEAPEKVTTAFCDESPMAFNCALRVFVSAAGSAVTMPAATEEACEGGTFIAKVTETVPAAKRRSAGASSTPRRRVPITIISTISMRLSS
jgi:hypothetical protein